MGAREALHDGIRVSFGADGAQKGGGEHCAIADLGVFDWMPKLTGDGRTRFVASGFGLQLVPLVFAE